MTVEPNASLGVAGERAAAKPVQERTLWHDAWRRFVRNRLAVVGLVIVGLMLFTAIFADLLAPTRYDHAVVSEALQFPSARHPLGTDRAGHDFLSRLIYGTRTSLLVAIAVQCFAFAVGIPLGMLAGLRGGKVDFLVMRMVEVMTAFPAFLFAVFMMSILGAGLPNIIIALAITSWIESTRLTRAQFMSLREREFVLAARACGATEKDVALRHLLPGTLPALAIMLALGIPTVIFAEAGLSFLGLGINEPLPSWGKMVGDSLNYIRVYWFLGLFPTLAIALAMFGFNFMGDGLRDALDPTMSR